MIKKFFEDLRSFFVKLGADFSEWFAPIAKWFANNKAWLIPVVLIMILLTALGAYLGRKKYDDLKLFFQAQNTQKFIDDHAEKFLVTYIDGPQGSGKTTFGAGLTNALSVRNQNLFKSRMKNATILFHDIDFFKVNNIIESQISEKRNEYDCTEKIAEVFPNFTDKIDTKLKLISGMSVLRQYVDGYYGLKRDNYVMFPNCEFKSYINGKYAMNYDPNYLNLKDLFEKKLPFLIPRGTVIYEDEKQNASGKDCYNNFRYVSQDTGSLKAFEYIRHIGDGMIFYITTDQTFNASNAAERKLSTAIVRVLGLEIKTVREPLDRIYSIKHRVLNSIYKRRANKQGVDFLLQNQKLRWQFFKLKQHRNEIFAQSYVQYKVLIYHSAGDVGKKVEATTFGGESRTFTFPIQSAFGSIDTHMFAFLYDQLRGAALPSEDDLLYVESPKEITQKILKKIDEDARVKDQIKEKQRAKKEAEKEQKKKENEERKLQARIELLEKQKANRIEIEAEKIKLRQQAKEKAKKEKEHDKNSLSENQK